MITQRSRYALKALIRLARAPNGESMRTKDIAEADGIPQAFLEQIMLDLKRLRLVASKRGREGGYVLATDPHKLTLAAVLRQIDGPVAPLPCLSRTAYQRCVDCRDEASCALRHIFAETHAATLAVLEKRTLAEAIAASDMAASEQGDYGADVFSGAFI
jgi:Rrf2 family protein